MMTKRDTRKELELAVARIEHGRPKVVSKARRPSILAVAEEARVSPAAIHNRHPEIAEKIRALVAQRKDRLPSPRRVTDKDVIRDLRMQLADRESDIRKLGTINLRMMAELQAAQAEIERHRSSATVVPLNRRT